MVRPSQQQAKETKCFKTVKYLLTQAKLDQLLQCSHRISEQWRTAGCRMEIEAGSLRGVMRVCDVTQTWVEAKDDFENEKNHRVWNGEWLCFSTPAAPLCLKRAFTIKTARKMSEWAYILDETGAKFKRAPKGGGAETWQRAHDWAAAQFLYYKLYKKLLSGHFTASAVLNQWWTPHSFCCAAANVYHQQKTTMTWTWGGKKKSTGNSEKSASFQKSCLENGGHLHSTNHVQN